MSAGSNIEKKERKKAKETHETNDLIFTQSEVSLIGQKYEKHKV